MNRKIALLAGVCLMAFWIHPLCAQSTVDTAFDSVQWEHPTIDADNYLTWHKFVWPAESELGWQKVRWHIELADAQAEAKKLQRPILLWTMNGHPCGET